MPRGMRSWPADFSGVSRDSSVAVDVISPMATPGRGRDSGGLDDSTVVRGMFGRINSDACPSRLPGPEQCCRGQYEWKRGLEHSPISLALLIAMRALNVGVISSGAIAFYLSILCAVEDLGLGGWAELFFVLGFAQVGLGAFGIFATYFHIWLLFYLFAMVVLWLVAIWLALVLPGYFTYTGYILGYIPTAVWTHVKSDGGLQQRFLNTTDPSSPAMSTLKQHDCEDIPFDQWHPACRGVLAHYVEEELHLNLWRSQLICGVVLLILGSIFSFLTVGPRTAVDVVLDGARYMQGSVAVTWACVTLYWYFFLDWHWGGFMALILFGVSVALCVVPCCISSGREEVQLRGRRAAPPERLKWYRARFSGRCGVLSYALLATLSIMAASYCLSGQEGLVEDKRTQLDKVGWTMVFVAEVEVLQCVCLLYKGWVARTRRRERAAAPYRESSI